MIVVPRIFAILCWLAVCLPMHMASQALTGHSRWSGRFLRGVGRIVGLRPVIVGTPAPAPVLYLANHLSWLDIVLLGGLFGTRFVAKAEISRWPIVGFLARENNTLFVEREARGAVREQMQGVARALTGRQPVAIFPEGTTGTGEAVAPFRASLLAAVTPVVTVQPVAIDYGTALAVLRWPKTETAPTNALRVIGHRGGIPVTVTLLPPIPSDQDRKAIAQQAHAAVAGIIDATR